MLGCFVVTLSLRYVLSSRSIRLFLITMKSQCIRVMLCGQKCRSSASIHLNSRAAQWKLKRVTPGMVAFAATAVRITS